MSYLVKWLVVKVVNFFEFLFSEKGCSRAFWSFILSAVLLVCLLALSGLVITLLGTQTTTEVIQTTESYNQAVTSNTRNFLFGWGFIYILAWLTLTFLDRDWSKSERLNAFKFWIESAKKDVKGNRKEKTEDQISEEGDTEEIIPLYEESDLKYQSRN